jgi:hypothetical protein
MKTDKFLVGLILSSHLIKAFKSVENGDETISYQKYFRFSFTKFKIVDLKIVFRLESGHFGSVVYPFVSISKQSEIQPESCPVFLATIESKMVTYNTFSAILKLAIRKTGVFLVVYPFVSFYQGF